MNKRLAMLEQLTASPAADAFAWYALAMEYRNEGRIADALRAFETLRSSHPEYLAQYLMAGQLLIDDNRLQEARPWLSEGLALAKVKNDSKAISELESALEQTVVPPV